MFRVSTCRQFKVTVLPQLERGLADASPFLVQRALNLLLAAGLGEGNDDIQRGREFLAAAAPAAIAELESTLGAEAPDCSAISRALFHASPFLDETRREEVRATLKAMREVGPLPFRRARNDAGRRWQACDCSWLTPLPKTVVARCCLGWCLRFM